MPRTKTISYPVYKFSELSDKAKEKAKQDHFEAFGYCMADEAMTSLKKLAEHFGGKLSDWSVYWDGFSGSHAKFLMPDMEHADIRDELAKLGTYNKKTLKGDGECKLTGVCTDEDCIDGFRIAFLKDEETDLSKLMQAAFKSWLKAQQANYESEWEDKQFEEECEANNYEFQENGEID